MAKQFFAILEGEQEVPPVETNARGQATLRVNDDRSMLQYRLTVNNLANFTEAHIHLGRRGENGPVVAFLFGPVDPGITVTQGTVQGTVNESSLVGPLEGQPFSELLRQMEAGNTYVNVHTRQNPAGEIRGQISDIKRER